MIEHCYVDYCQLFKYCTVLGIGWGTVLFAHTALCFSMFPTSSAPPTPVYTLYPSLSTQGGMLMYCEVLSASLSLEFIRHLSSELWMLLYLAMKNIYNLLYFLILKFTLK